MIRLFSLFSGYGGAEFGLKKAEIPYELIGYSEIDKHAINIFENNFPEAKGKNYGDCSKIITENLPDFDLLTGGFPCQDVSIAGKRDLNKGRTNLYLEILRIAKQKKPRYLVLENVKGLLSVDLNEQSKLENKLIDKIVRDLKNIGYGVAYKVLNSKDYGIPQNRERIWFICKYDGWEFMEFLFPEKEKLLITLKDILETEVDEKYYLTPERIKTILGKEGTNYENKINPEVSNCLRTNYSNATSNETYIEEVSIMQQHRKGEIRKFQNISPTLTKKEGGNQTNYVQVKSIALRDKNRSKHQAEGTPYGTYEKDYHLKERDDEISFAVKSSTHEFMIKEKTRDVIQAIDVAKSLSEKENTPIQLDIYHLKSGEIRPLSTYIPQNFDIHRCLQAGTPKEILVEKETIRKLTPKECFRLMGFLKDEIDLTGISDSQLYKLAGNGWDINLVSKIFKKMFPEKKNDIR